MITENEIDIGKDILGLPDVRPEDTARQESSLDDQWGKLPFQRWKNAGRTWYVPLTNITTSASLGDSFHSITIPRSLDGAVLIAIEAAVTTAAAASGPILIQINNGTVDMLTTRVSIDDGEKTSATAATPAVIDTTNNIVRTGMQVDIDIDDIADGGAFGWQLFLHFQ